MQRDARGPSPPLTGACRDAGGGARPGVGGAVGGGGERSGTWPRRGRRLRCPPPGPAGPAAGAKGHGRRSCRQATRGSCWRRWRCRSVTPPSRWRRSWRRRRLCRPRWRSSPPSARRTPGSSEHGGTCCGRATSP